MRHSIDVTSYVQQAIAQGDSEVSFRMRSNRYNNQIKVASSEYAILAERPMLRTSGFLENTAPAAVDDSYSTVNGGYVFVAGAGSRVGASSVVANDSDRESNYFTISLVTDVQHGVLDFRDDGSFTYVATEGYVGTDQFTYRLNDGLETTDATVTVTVEPTETYYVESDHDARVSERFRTTNYRSNTTIPINDDDDGDGDYEHGYFKFPVAELAGDLLDVFLDFTPTSVASSTSLSIYGTGASWDESTITYNTQPSVGSFVGSVGSLTANQRRSIDVTGYVRAAVDAGEDEVSFRMISNRSSPTYVATSEHGNRDFRPLLRATGRLGNRAPIVVDDSYSTVNGGYVLRAGVGSRTSTPSVLANDSDVEGNRINVSLVTDVQNGSLSLEPDGSFTYIANTDFVGTDQFVYRADDGVDAVDGTVTITVEESQTYFIETEHDARVSERFRTTNYQNGTTIPINDDDDGDGDYEHAYFKFPISEIEGNLSEVFLDFTPTTLGGSSVTLSLYGTATDWNESSITYQEQPAIGSFGGFGFGNLDKHASVD